MNVIKNDLLKCQDQFTLEPLFRILPQLSFLIFIDLFLAKSLLNQL